MNRNASMAEATDIQLQTDDTRARTAYTADSFNLIQRSRSNLQSQLNKRRLRNNIESRGAISTTNKRSNTVKSSSFFKSSLRECCDLNSDKDASEPFMDVQDYTLREPHANKYTKTLSRQ